MIRRLDIPIYDTNVLFLLDVTGEEFAEFIDNEQNKSRITEEEIKSIFDDIKNDKWDYHCQHQIYSPHQKLSRYRYPSLEKNRNKSQEIENSIRINFFKTQCRLFRSERYKESK